MIKFRLYFDKDPETVWLNEMSADGWALTGFFAGFYRFEKCEKGEYIYQIDFGDKLYAVSNEYRELMNELGIEIVVLWGYWIILRKKAADGPFELYTDVDSQIEHYRKIRRMFKVVTILELICFWAEMFAGFAGNDFAWGFGILILVFILVIVNAVFRINDVLEDLEEKKSGIVSERKGRNVPALIPVGLLLSCVMFLVEESVSVVPWVSWIVHILAIGMMAVGLVMLVQERKR